MKKRRVLLLTLLTLLLLIGIPTVLLLREYHHEQASRKLIEAIQIDNREKVLNALKEGANPNLYTETNEERLTFWQHCLRIFTRPARPPKPPELYERLTLFLLYLNNHPDDDPTLVQTFLEAGADPRTTGWVDFRQIYPEGEINFQGRNGGTALHLACCNGNLETLKILLRYQAPVNARDQFDETPLDWAIFNHREKIIQAMRKAGAKTGQELSSQSSH